MNISFLISKRLKEILRMRHFSQYKLEMLSGISHSTLSCIMSKRYNALNLKTLFVIIQALDMTILDFFNSPLFENLYNINLD